MTALPKGIYKRGSSYYVQYKQDGKWKHRSVGPNLPAALELHEQLRSGTSYPPDAIRFQELIERYLARQRIYSKPKSVKNASNSARRLTDHFGNRVVVALGTDDLDRFVQARREKVTAKTVNGDLIILRAILNQGISDGKLETLPFKVKLLRVSRKKVVRILSKKDMRRLLDHARDPYYGIILVAASTGFRADEILHLRWSDIHFEAGQIAVTSKENWTSKSYQERICYVAEPVLKYLLKRRSEAEFSREVDWVFSSSKGTPLDLHRVSRNVRRVFESSGLYRPGEGTLHLIRHSVASRLLQEKVDLETVREILGHSLLSTTALYIHSTNEAKREAATKLDLAGVS